MSIDARTNWNMKLMHWSITGTGLPGGGGVGYGYRLVSLLLLRAISSFVRYWNSFFWRGWGGAGLAEGYGYRLVSLLLLRAISPFVR